MREKPKPVIVAGSLPMVVDTGRRKPPRNFWPKFWSTLGAIPFSEELASAWYCAIDEKTPGRVKGVLFAAIGYFVLPTDILPDFIAGIGFTDDATVLATAMGIVAAHIKPVHRNDARKLLRLPEGEIQGEQ